MKTLSILFSVFLILATISALIASVYYAIHFVIALFASLDAQIASIIYATVIAMLFSTMIISLIMRWWQKQGDIEQLRKEKTAVYQRFLGAWSKVLSHQAPEDPQKALHLKKEIQEAEKQLLLWGSSSVVSSYTVCRKRALQSNPRDPAVLPLIDKVLVTMRRDLGQSNLGLHAGELLTLLLNNDSPNPQENSNSTLHASDREAYYART